MMRWGLAICVLLAILAGHFLYATRDVSIRPGRGEWATYEFESPPTSRWDRYVVPGEYWIGLSYGVAGAFAALSLARALRLRRGSLGTSAGGLALGGLLWATVCFFAGCCGSPMLPVYLGLWGPRFLGVTGPLTFGLTLLSTLVGYTLILRHTRTTKAKDVDSRLHETA